MTQVVVDAELLVLLLAGNTSPDIIARHKNLSAYTLADYALLLDVLRQAQTVVVTPNTLTEASNLIRQIGEPDRRRLTETLANLAEHCPELYVESTLAIKQPEFERLGLTDAALLALSSAERVLLTSDADLYIAAATRGLPVENFHHVREARGTV